VVYDNNIEVHVKCNACTAMSVDTGSTVSNAMNFDNRAQKFFFKKNVKANFQGHGVVCVVFRVVLKYSHMHHVDRLL
jgi:hypothetical protein